jgi:hypothetical protein
MRFNTMAAASVGALAFAALIGTEVSALAQDAGEADQGVSQSDAGSARRPLHLRRHREVVAARRDDYRPLTVGRRRVVAPGPVVVEGPRYNPYAGPAAIVTGPIAIGGEVASIPFRILSEIFPPVGPAAIIGLPVRAAGQIVQVPFQIAEAPFGGPGPFAY